MASSVPAAAVTATATPAPEAQEGKDRQTDGASRFIKTKTDKLNS